MYGGERAARAYCFLRNVHDVVENDKTPYELRHGTSFKGKKLPFGCLVSYKPNSKREVEQIQKFGSRTKEGIFAGYHLQSGGRWSGDYLIVDVDAYSASPDHRHVYVHRVEEFTIQGKPIFPVRSGVV